jgi:hypothetical protein
MAGITGESQSQHPRSLHNNNNKSKGFIGFLFITTQEMLFCIFTYYKKQGKKLS